jgi:hypothetical protein
MGKLIVMPSRNSEHVETSNAPAPAAAETGHAFNTHFAVWKNAPRERTAAYFPTYSAVSKAIQSAMRAWVCEWFVSNMEILQRPSAAYAILVYQCTHPFSGRPTNNFTYDIQQTDALNRAFRSAANKLGRQLKALDTKRFSWFTREHYFAYRSREVVRFVFANPRALYRMLHVETMLMDAILRFSIVDIPEIGLENALLRLRRTFTIQLHRFSEHFDLSTRSDELLHIATEALLVKLAVAAALPVPRAA